MAEIALAYPLLSSAAAGVAGSVVGGLFTGKDTPPPAAAPVVEKPSLMPTPGDADTRKAKTASIAEQMRRRGRASTILTDNGATSDTLGA